MKILILGAGKMIEAMLIGLVDKNNLKEIGIYTPKGISAKALAEKVGATWVQDLSQLDPEWVLLGCKPQDLKNLKNFIGDQFSKTLFISVVAAVNEQDQLKILQATRLVRLMPNLAVKNGQGIILLSSDSAGKNIPEITQYFQALGILKVVSGQELDELTLLTGSGPAFFYEFTTHLAQSFKSLSPSEREDLARQVFLGTASILSKDKESLSELTSRVTSKGGLTIAVLEKWREKNLKTLIESGVKAGRKRLEELRELLRQS